MRLLPIVTGLLIRWRLWKPCTCDDGMYNAFIWGHLAACPQRRRLWRR